MLADEANQQKQKKREEQLRRWRERENMEEQNNKNSSSTTSPIDKLQMYRKTSKVRFPKGCVFLAACASGDTDEVKQHLKLGVNINTTNIDGLTALHQACIDANIEIVKFLIDNNADINAQDNEGWTPLHAAVSVGNLEVTKYLIGKGAKLNICNNDSDLPVDLCDSGNTQMRELLEEEMRSQAIDAAFEKQREELLMYEDAKEKNFMDKIHAKTGATPLHVSSAKGYTRVMKLLIQSGANVNAFDNDGWTPLHAAAHWEQEEACKILAESGADFSIKTYSGQTPFDVCDNDMATKLRALQQANSKVSSSTINKSNDSTGTNVTNNSTIPNNNGNSFGKLDARSRRASDEFKSNSIARLTNEAKSSLSEKERKQDKILLSPISNANKPYFDLNYSDIETDTNRTQQHASGHTDVPQSTTTSTSTTTTNNNSLQQQQDKENYSNGSSNTLTSDPTKTPKSGLQETLKSLSAQVKMKIDEDQSDET
jgi:ankyrin repeat protein